MFSKLRPLAITAIAFAALLGAALSGCGELTPLPSAPTLGPGFGASGSPADAQPSPSGGLASAQPSPSLQPVAAGQISAANIEAIVTQQYAGIAQGATASVKCSRQGTFASVVGDSFPCTYSDGNGHNGVLTVNVISTKGDFTWVIGTPSASAVPTTPTP